MNRLTLVTILGLCLVLAGVNQIRPREVVKYPNRQRVTFWHMWTGEWQPIVEGACQRFNESQTEYEIVPLAIPPTDADTKFLLSAAGGNSPDLVSQWMPVKGAWADKGLLTPVEEVMSPGEKSRYLREAYPIILQQAQYRGKLVAAIASLDVYALYVRLDQLEEAGIQTSEIPTNLQDFIIWSRRLDRFDHGGALKRIGFLPQYGDRYIALFNGDFGTESVPILDSPRTRQAFELIYQSLKKIGFDKVQRFASSRAADAGMSAPLLTGDYTFLLDGQWRVKQAKDFAPQVRYAVLPMPVAQGCAGPASMTNANYLLIPKSGHCPKGAWAFIKYWIGFDNPDVGARNMAEMGWLPYSKKVADSAIYQNYLHQYPQFKTFVSLMASPHLRTPPVGPLQAFVTSQLAKVDESVSHGTTPPDEALSRAQATVDSELTRQRRMGNVR